MSLKKDRSSIGELHGYESGQHRNKLDKPRKNSNPISSTLAKTSQGFERGRGTNSAGISAPSNQTLLLSGFVRGPSNGKRRARVAGRSSSPTSPPRKKTRKASDGPLVPASASESDEIEEISPYSISGPGPGTLRNRKERARQEEGGFDSSQAQNEDDSDFDDPFRLDKPPPSDPNISHVVERMLEGPSEAEPRQLPALPWKQEKRASTTKHHVSRRVISPDDVSQENGIWDGISAAPQSNSLTGKALQAISSFPSRTNGRGKSKETPGTSMEHAIPVDDNLAVRVERNTTTRFLSPVSTTKSSNGGVEDDPIECSDQEHEGVNAPNLGNRNAVPGQVANGYEKSDVRSPSMPVGKVRALCDQYEGLTKPETSPLLNLGKPYGPNNASKTPIPVPLAGSRGPTVNGSRPQQKLSRSMGTREDSTNSTSNKSSNPTAHKMQGKIPPKSRNPQIDPDSLLPIKGFFGCEQMVEFVPNDSSRQYFLQWGPNALSLVDQARLEASASSTGRQFGKAQLRVFLWGDIHHVMLSKDPGNNPTILSFRLRDKCLRNYGLKGENNQFIIEFDLDHRTWNEQRYGYMKSRLRSVVPPVMDVDRGGSVALLDSIRLSSEIPTIEDEKAPTPTGSRETRRAMANAATSPKRTSERVKTAPLRLRDRANEPAIEDQSTDSDDGTSRTESDGLLSATRENDGNLRRSRRQRAAPLAVNLNDNELLFSYPPVNITRGDLGRLEPDEFLNDTLIEFGLKLWQNDLKEKNPQLADDIWVFNSFFYKKLSNRKVEGYPSVKKWTAKVDIFRKKFIVVPINENLHWYLAIIYQPGASLHSAARPKTPPPPPVTRASLKHVVQIRPPKLSSVSLSPLPEMEVASAANTDIEDSMEVDKELLGGDDSAKSPIVARGLMSPLESGPSSHMDVDGSEGGIVEEDGDVEMASRFPEASKPGPVKVSNAEGPDAEPLKDLLEYASDDEPNHLQPHDPRPPDLTELAKKCSLGDDTSSDEISPNEDGKAISDEVPKPTASEPRSTGQIEQTYIFILDSLGSKHPSVFNTLREWLFLEAQDKRNEEIPKPANNGKYVKVPYQPNHVDCGVYLLHFAETFIAKADEIIPLTLTTRKLDDAALRDSIFDKELLKKKRATLKDRVIELANAWKASHPETVSISTEKRPSPSDAPTHQQESSTKEADLHDMQHPPKAQVPVEDPSEQASNSGERDEPVQEAANDSLPVDSAVGTTRDNEVDKPQQKPPSSVSGRPEPREDSDDEIQFIGETKPQPPSRTKPSRAAPVKGKGARHKG